MAQGAGFGASLPAPLRGPLRLGFAFSTRALGAFGGYIFSLIIARAGGPETLGQVTLFISVLGLLSLLAVRGQNMVIMRDTARLAQSHDRRQAQIAVIEGARTLWWSIGLAALAGAALLASGLLGQVPDFSGPIFLVTLPLFAGLSLMAGYVKGLDQSWMSPFFEIGGLSLVAALLLWLVMPGVAAELPHMSLLLAMGVGVVATVILLRPGGNPAPKPLGSPNSDRRLGQGNTAFLITAVATYATQGGVFLLAAPFLSSEDLGLLRGAERLAIMVSFVSLAINPFIAPRIVRQVEAGNRVQLRRLMAKAVGAGAAFGLAPLVLLLSFPVPALTLMGEAFASAKGLLVALACVQYAMLLASPFVMVLAMGGQEKVGMWISLGALGSAVVLIPLGTVVFGLAGFVVSYAVVVLGRTFASLILSFRRLM